MILRFFFCLMMFASAAQAQVCIAVQNAVTYEADLIDTDNGYRPFNIRTLAALRLNARRLHDYYVPDPFLAQAVTAYIDSVTKLTARPAGHADPLHRSHVYHLILASDVPCAGQISAPTSNTAPRTATSLRARILAAPAQISRQPAQSAALLLATILCTLCLIFVYYRCRQSRRERLDSLAGADSFGETDTRTGKAAHIDAKGTRVDPPQNPDQPALKPPGASGKVHRIKMAWQNSKLGGLFTRSSRARHPPEPLPEGKAPSAPRD